MTSGYAEKERVSGVFKGEQVRFSRVWSGHRFTDKEVAALLAGETIHFTSVSKAGNKYEAYGYLDHLTFTNSAGKEIPYVGFHLDFDAAPEDTIPWSFAGHQFSDAEHKLLESGAPIHVEGLVSKRTGNTYDADLRWGDDADNPGRKRILISFD